MDRWAQLLSQADSHWHILKACTEKYLRIDSLLFQMKIYWTSDWAISLRQRPCFVQPAVGNLSIYQSASIDCFFSYTSCTSGLWLTFTVMRSCHHTSSLVPHHSQRAQTASHPPRQQLKTSFTPPLSFKSCQCLVSYDLCQDLRWSPLPIPMKTYFHLDLIYNNPHYPRIWPGDAEIKSFSVIVLTLLQRLMAIYVEILHMTFKWAGSEKIH